MTLPLAPFDLTVNQIEAAFAAALQVRELALEGHTEREIAAEMEWRVEDVRAAAHLQGFSTCDLLPRQQLCPVCGHLLGGDGRCEVCLLRGRLVAMREVNQREHEREVERLDNALDAEKQDTKRTRERMGDNPRKKTKREFAVEFATDERAFARFLAMVRRFREGGEAAELLPE